nr:very-long-chain (3R)-3-hydroxyacyl-CoA dehydratase 4 isoform X2 [Dromaius novaehollandiae]
MNTYLFVYDLMQFCGHSWIFTNMIIRFMSFGKDSLADTFYSIGLVMRLCQLLSVLEILHILAGIDKSRLFPRFLQRPCTPQPKLGTSFPASSTGAEIRAACANTTPEQRSLWVNCRAEVSTKSTEHPCFLTSSPPLVQSFCSRIISVTIKDTRWETERPEQETSDPDRALQPLWCSPGCHRGGGQGRMWHSDSQYLPRSKVSAGSLLGHIPSLLLL